MISIVRQLAIVVFCLLFAARHIVAADKPLWNGARYNDAVSSTGADLLHAIGITGKGLATAVINGGFDTDHEIFGGGKIVNYYSGPQDNHGTHVSGIVLSMAPDSDLWLGTFYDYISTFSQLAADAEKYNIFAVNNSWGDVVEGRYSDPDDVAQWNPEANALVQQLIGQGVAFVGASGNWAVNDRFSFPDGLPGVLSAGALNPFGNIAGFSSQREKDGLFLLAPGVNVFSSLNTDSAGNSVYGTMSGTSMAAPHVTGAVTLLKSGARMASSEEIVAALYDSADRISFDGSAIIKKKHMPEGRNPARVQEFVDQLSGSRDLGKYIQFIAAAVDYANDSVSGDTWRLLNHILYAAFIANEYYDLLGFSDSEEAFLIFMETTGDLAPLQHTEYGIMRVDKAYRTLTGDRSFRLAQRAAAAGSSHASAMFAYSSELRGRIDQDLADLFQRLDGQSDAVLTRAARQLGPAFVDSTLQSSIFGMLDLHATAQRRIGLARQKNAFAACPEPVAATEDTAAPEGYMCLVPESTLPRRWTAWGEGFGGYHHRRETRDGSGYNGSFAGVMAGLEFNGGDVVAGAFAAWANHNLRGDGRSRGNWGTLGGYAGVMRGGFSLGASWLAGMGDYSLTRGVHGPGSLQTGMEYDPITIHSRGDGRALSFSGRVVANWDVVDCGEWSFGPIAEGSFAYATMEGFKEKGSGLALSVDRHSQRYAEGGAGLGVAKRFTGGKRPFVVSARVMGLYGRGFADAMTGSFVGGGSTFRVKPERVASGWCVPEASISWQASERVTVTAAYQGRFGRRVSTNTGSMSLGIS